MSRLMVCAACGHPACFEGSMTCDDAFRVSGISWCTCDWGDEGDYVLISTNAHCPTHGDDEAVYE
jgi:hypothetical protein